MFKKMRNILWNLSLNIHTKIRILKCYVLSTLLYGAEAWTLTDASCRRIDTFEMWCYRHILRIPWIHHVLNDTVLQRIGRIEFLQNFKRRKLEYFGHVMRNEKYHLLTHPAGKNRGSGQQDADEYPGCEIYEHGPE